MIKTKLLHNRRARKGSQPIEIQVYLGRSQRAYYSTGIAVLPNQWDKKKFEVINHDHKDLINTTLKNITSELEAAYLRSKFKNIDFTLEMAKAIVQHKEPEKKDDDFIAWGLDRIQQDMSLAPASKRSQIRMFQELQFVFNELPFNSINLELLYNFDNHLRKYFADNTTKRFHKDFKKFIRLAIALEKIKPEKNPYLRFKTGAWKPKQEFLQTSELKKIEDADLFGIDLAELVRDMFLFSCFTGLRYSDLHRLKKSDFDKRDGGLVLNLKATQKTETPVFLRLYDMFSGKPETIIQKYFDQSDNDALIWGKVITNARFNQLLKAIQLSAGIKTNLTAHLARHTFGTHFARETGNVLQVMAAMSIRKFDTARIYINLAAQLD